MADILHVMVFLFASVVCFRFTSSAEEGVIHFNISENSPEGTIVGNIANNMNSLQNASLQVKENAGFTFLQPNGANNIYFNLNSASGTLTTSNMNIDRESVCPYNKECSLEVTVAVKSVDGYFDVATVMVEILDQNDNKPTFPVSSIILNISEVIPAGAEYTITPAEDPDMSGNNSVQSYELMQGYDIFDLIVSTDRVGGYSLKLILKQALDREIKDYYSAKVVARDGGVPVKEGTLNIDVNVIDSNDNSPVFEKDFYNVTIEESIAPGTVILNLSATDLDSGKNGELSYRFRQRQSDIDLITRLFHISETTGELSVISDLHSEQSESFRFFVDAIDNGDQPNANHTLVLVQIEDATNNAPVVTLHLVDSDKIGFVSLPENSKIGSFVAHINVEDTDKGQNGNVSCRSENENFGLEKLPVRGYKIITLALLDREKLPLHDVKVTCFDNGSPSLSSSVSFLVSLEDENDNSPQFDSTVYHAQISENNELGQNITKVLATDIDAGINKMFEYALHPVDNQEQFFSINSNTGTIYAIRSLDRETHPKINFRVLAIDKGSEPQTGTATVSLTVLDQNDNIPHMTPARPKLEIRENMPANTSVGLLNGTDDDVGINAQMVYEIAPLAASFPFELTKDGEFRTKEKLDRELQNRYEIPVTVRDMGFKPLSNTQYVTIIVKDENDNAPIVTFPNDVNDSVNFVYPVGEYNVVTSINAYDVDDGENGTVSFSLIGGNEKGIFDIDPNFGEISVRNTVELEKDTQMVLVVKVQDRGVIPHFTTVSLTMNIIFGNATFASTEDSGNNKHVIIAVVVVIVTVLLAVGIVGIILFLRSMDRNKNRDSEDGSAGYSDSGISSRSDSNTLPAETDNGNGEAKKKKEVSFALEYSLNGLDGGRNVETSTDSGVIENRYYDAPPSYQSLNNIQQEKIDSHMKAIKLQQYLWEAKSRQWEQGNVQPLPLGDSESETSRETITCDSGRGGSEDDEPVSSPHPDDRKSFGFIDSKSSGKRVTFKTNHSTNRQSVDFVLSPRESTPVREGKPPLVHRHSSSDVPRRELVLNNTKLTIKNFPQTNSQNSTNNIHTVPVQRSEPWNDYFKHHSCHNVPHMRHDSFSSVRSNDDDGGSTTTSGSYTLDPEDVADDVFHSRPGRMNPERWREDGGANSLRAFKTRQRDWS